MFDDRGLTVLELSATFKHSERNISMDNFFTDMFLGATLLQNGLTLVGTVRRNKTFIPINFLSSRKRERKKVPSLGFRRIQHLYLMFQKGIKVYYYSQLCIMMIMIVDDEAKKPEMNIFYSPQWFLSIFS